VDRKETNGEITKGIYSEQLTAEIGEGAYDEGGHRNTQFLGASGIGPYPREMQRAWDVLRDETGENYGFQEEFQEEEARERMGPMAEPTPTVIRNRGAADRKKTGRVEAVGAGRKEETGRGAGEEVERR
jgi:hypothetical protein